MATTFAIGTSCHDTTFGQVPGEDTSRPAEMRLWKEIDISDWSGTFPCLGDLDNDGRVDFLLYRQGPQTTPGYLVAVDHDGKMLWEMGDSSIVGHSPDGAWKEPALRGIGFIYDIDGDDRSEVIAEFWKDGKPMLRVLYQPYNGKSILIFTQPDSDGAEKVYIHQQNVYSIHSYF